MSIFDFSGILNSFGIMGQVLSYTWFVFLPPIFFLVFMVLWQDYASGKFASKVKYSVLEIIPPREIEKSPRLMESFFSGLAGTWKGFNTKEKYIDGAFTLKFSLEIVSDGGNVHFYIRTPKAFVNLVESNIYAQYPDAEIKEVPDYVDNVPKVVPNQDWDLWGSDFELVDDDAIPIKTYHNFQEDVTGNMIDPLSALLEVFGKIAPDQKLWLQWIIAPETEGWVKKGKETVEKIAGRAAPKKKTSAEKLTHDIGDILGNIPSGLSKPPEFKSAEEAPKDQDPLEFRLTPGEKNKLKAVEENISKNMFITKMRFLYLGKRENFNKTIISASVGAIKQFNDITMNSFKPNDRSKTFANYLLTNSRLLFKQRKIFQRYKDRDSRGKTFMMSTSELATIYHLPDMSVLAPNIYRVDSKRGGAPGNLPIE